MTKTGKTLRYDEGCLGAHALNLVGDRWALLVVRAGSTPSAAVAASKAAR